VLLASTCVTCVVAACGGGTSAPSDPYVGTWTGTLADSTSGEGVLRLTLSDAPDLAGSWEVVPPGPVGAGAVSRLPDVPGDPQRHFGLRCGPGLTGGSILLSTTLSGNTMVGTYVGAGCEPLTRGRAQLARR